MFVDVLGQKSDNNNKYKPGISVRLASFTSTRAILDDVGWQN
jgi:hypothetical protein